MAPVGHAQQLLNIGLDHPNADIAIESLAPAIEHLEDARRLDTRLPLALRLLAVGYGRQEDFGMSARYSAEFALKTGKIDDAIGQADKAIRLLPAGSVARRQAEDIKQEAENLKKG